MAAAASIPRCLRVRASFVAKAWIGAAILFVAGSVFTFSAPHLMAGPAANDAALMGLFGLACLGAAVVQLWVLSHARQVAEDFEKVDVRFIGKEEITYWGDNRTGRVRYRYRVTRSDGRISRRSVVFSGGKHPIFVQAHRLLALRTPRSPDRLIVLRNDLYPFEARPEEL